MLCSRDALAPVGLARWDVDRLSAALVGGLPYRFTSMLQASCLAGCSSSGCIDCSLGKSGERISSPISGFTVLSRLYCLLSWTSWLPAGCGRI